MERKISLTNDTMSHLKQFYPRFIQIELREIKICVQYLSLRSKMSKQII